MIPFEAVRTFVPEMPAPSPDVPTSPFSLARRNRVQTLLEDAGFEEVQFEEFKSSTRMGWGDLDTCMQFIADFSNPVATALRQSDAETTPKILETVRSAVEPFHNGKTIALPASVWIVTASRS